MKNNSAGNILFIILIAVALFAALGYAVTMASRKGGNDASQETNLVDSSVLQQYTAAVRGAVTHMGVNGVGVTALEFNPPSDFSSLTSASVGVFHASGGAIVYQYGPLSVIDPAGGNASGKWIFTMNFEVKEIGMSAASSLDGNEVMAFLVGIKKSVCERLDTKLGIPINPLPQVSDANYSVNMISNSDSYYQDNDYVLPTSELVIGNGAGDAALAGKQEGCYLDASGNSYVYYSVISGR